MEFSGMNYFVPAAAGPIFGTMVRSVSIQALANFRNAPTRGMALVLASLLCMPCLMPCGEFAGGTDTAALTALHGAAPCDERDRCTDEGCEAGDPGCAFPCVSCGCPSTSFPLLTSGGHEHPLSHAATLPPPGVHPLPSAELPLPYRPPKAA